MIMILIIIFKVSSDKGGGEKAISELPLPRSSLGTHPFHMKMRFIDLQIKLIFI